MRSVKSAHRAWTRVAGVAFPPCSLERGRRLAFVEQASCASARAAKPASAWTRRRYARSRRAGTLFGSSSVEARCRAQQETGPAKSNSVCLSSERLACQKARRRFMGLRPEFWLQGQYATLYIVCDPCCERIFPTSAILRDGATFAFENSSRPYWEATQRGPLGSRGVQPQLPPQPCPLCVCRPSSATDEAWSQMTASASSAGTGACATGSASSTTLSACVSAAAAKVS